MPHQSLISRLVPQRWWLALGLLTAAALAAFAVIHAAPVKTESADPSRAQPLFSSEPRWLDEFLVAHGAAGCVPEQIAPDVARRVVRDTLRFERHGLHVQSWQLAANRATYVLTCLMLR